MMKRFAWLQIRDRAAFVRLTGVLFLVYLATGLWSPLLAVYTRSLGAQTGQIGLVLATFQITNLASQYWWGRYSDRLGRRKPLLLLGTAGMALAYLGIASAGQYGWLFAARALEGVALSAYSTGSLALIGDLLEDQAGRGRLMGTYRTFGSLAFAIAALSGGWLADSISLRVPFAIAALCYLLAFVLGTRISERTMGVSPSPADEEQKTKDEISAPSNHGLSSSVLRQRSRALWSFLALLGVWMFAMSAVVPLWPVFMANIGYSKTAIGGLWSLAALGEVPCMILAGHLSDRWGRKRVMLTGFVGMSGVYLAYTLSPALAWIVGVQLVRAFAYASMEAPALLYATELGLRRQRGRLAGLFYSAGSLGAIAGSIVGGVIAQWVGLPSMFRMAVVLMLAVALVIGKVMPRLRSVQPDLADLSLDARRARHEV
jgi:PPP family 3-phenylpropionic acid transporter